MKVCLLTCTKDRHQHIERVVRFVLDQTVNNYVHLIYNNSVRPLRLASDLPSDRFVLINNPLSLTTGKPYTTLGEIYNDAITYIPEDCDVVTMMDDDDLYSPQHVEKGLDGLVRGGKLAYKPKRSWYRYLTTRKLVENVMEPSIFVKTEHIKKYGFSLETTAQHHQWLAPLESEDQIFVDPNGEPTFTCDWSQSISTFKTSGDPHNPINFQNYEKHTQDFGDDIITPAPVGLHNYK